MEQSDLDLLRSLEASLAGRYRAVVIDVDECPVFFAAAMPEMPPPPGVPPRLPCGRGLAQTSALLSALGEAVELDACLADETLPACFGSRNADGLAMVRGVDLGSGRVVNGLAQHVFLDWAKWSGEPEVFRANTTGCAAYTDLDGATERGLLECVERDAKALWWHGRMRCPRLPVSLLDMVQPRLAWWLQQRSRRFALIDITCDTHVPVVAAASWDGDGRNLAIGSAAAPTAHAAALSATTEMLQTELALRVGSVHGNDELRAWQESANAHDMPQLAGAEAPPRAGANAGSVASHLIALGFSCLRFDLTRHGSVLRAVRMSVPGLGGMGPYLSPQRIVDFASRNPALTDVSDPAGLDRREPY